MKIEIENEKSARKRPDKFPVGSCNYAESTGAIENQLGAFAAGNFEKIGENRKKRIYFFKNCPRSLD